MKAISLIQPWASLIVDGKKTIETRSWYTPHRGGLAIHASKKVDAEACRDFGYDPKTIPRGEVLGTAIVRNCVRFPHPEAPPDAYGDFEPGRFGIILTNIEKFPAGIPAKGSLGLWDWNWPEVAQ